MKTLIARTLLTLALLVTVGLAVAAGKPYAHSGVISQVEATTNAVVIRQQIYALGNTVNIHGIPKAFPTASDLRRGMNIGFNVSRNRKTGRDDLITEIWVIPQ